MTRLNLLPWREIARKAQDRQLLSIAIGAWITTCLVVFYAHLHVTNMIETQGVRNKFLEDEIKKVDEQIKEIKELKKQRDALVARMQVIQQLQQDRSRIVHMFDDLIRKLPEGVVLTKFAQTNETITLTGRAQSNARIAAFMRNLDGSDWYANPALDIITETAQSGERVRVFTLRVTQKKTEEGKKSP
jgi:type IV pilus assembly protein PilN